MKLIVKDALAHDDNYNTTRTDRPETRPQLRHFFQELHEHLDADRRCFTRAGHIHGIDTNVRGPN